MPRKRSAALQQAVDYLHSGIGRGVLRKQEFLPNIRDLAVSAGVSQVTMWKAVQELKLKGILEGEPGCRPRVAGKGGDSIEAAYAGVSSHGEKWRKVRARVQHDILSGIFPPGEPLPPTKDLLRRYDVGRRTLKKAVASLEDEFVVMPGTRSYMVRPPAASAHPHIGITILGPIHEMFWQYWHKEFYRHLSHQCSRWNIGFTTIGFTHTGETCAFVDPATKNPTEVIDKDTTIGYMLHITNPQAFSENMLRQLLAYRKPVAVLDEVGGWEMPRFMRNSPYVKVFTMTTSREAGRCVARYLLAQGHRSVAFISPQHKDAWSVSRLEGLKTAQAQSGMAFSLREFTLGYDIDDYKTLSRDHSNATAIEAFCEKKWVTNLPSCYLYYVKYAMDQLTWVGCAQAEMHYQLMPVFDELIDTKEITAWILVNDNTAGIALRHLVSCNIDVPARVSLISFDDAPEAVEDGLTSYNFNFPAVGDAMLNFVMRFDRQRPGTPQKAVEIPGYIVERGSTWKV